MQSSISGSITNLSEKLHNRSLYLYEVVCKNYPKIKKLQKPIDFFEIRCYNIQVKKICVPPEHIGLSVKRVFVEVVTLTTARSHWFEPSSGSQKKALAICKCFFQRNKSLMGFVKCTSRVKCAAAREGSYFISHCDEGAIFHNLRSKLFHIRHRRIFHLKE